MSAEQTITVAQIAAAIEAFAPKRLQETYDNTGLQVGSPDTRVTGVMLCLDVTREILEEARRKGCNMVISHHPLIFGGLKNLTGANEVQRVAIEAVRTDMVLYAAHTNLDSTNEGVSYEIAHRLGVESLQVLSPKDDAPGYGLGVVGDIPPMPALEFLRRVKETFSVRCLRYSTRAPRLVVHRVAVCGGAGASLLREAVAAGADVMLTGDVKYHDFTSWGDEILIADIGHYESELCATKIIGRILAEQWPSLPQHEAKAEKNPIGCLC